MVKAVFFDWFDTLVRYDPPRQQLYQKVLGESGFEVSPKELMIGLMAADKYFLEENARSPITQRSPKEQAEVYMRYQGVVLAQAGVNIDREILPKLLKKIQPLLQGLSFVLFDDVLPTLKSLKERGLILGLLTNASKNILAVQSKLGLDSYLNFVVTSEEAGADKPLPPIFLAALECAGVNAAEAIHVGDHYHVDVLGAKGVGIKPILLDRYDLYPEVSDCPRIHSLTELVNYL